MGGITIEDAAVEARLATKGGIEAGRIYPDRLGEIGNADRIVAAGVKKALLVLSLRLGRRRFIDSLPPAIPIKPRVCKII